MHKITAQQLQGSMKEVEFFEAMASLDIDRAVEISDSMSNSILRKSLNTCRDYRKELADK